MTPEPGALERDAPSLATALHEAGHAVAAVELGIDFDTVALGSDGRSDGRISGIAYPDVKRPDPEAVEEFLAYLYAGAAAVAALYGAPVIAGSSEDRLQAEYWAAHIFARVSEYRDGQQRAQSRAGAIVRERSQAVRAVAAALLNEGQLSVDRVRAIVAGLGSDGAV